jgi:hypothetical protein
MASQKSLPSITLTAAASAPTVKRTQRPPCEPNDFFAITVTATLHYHSPITLCTSTAPLFRDQLVHHQGCPISASRHLSFVSQRTDTAVPNRRLCVVEQKYVPVDWRHEEDFFTLMPEEPHVLEMRLGPWRSARVELEAGDREWNFGVGDHLQVGEEYRVEVPDGSAVRWWVEGRKEDVLRAGWISWLLGLVATKSDAGDLRPESEWIPLEIKESPVFVVTE